jgi:hypothetical protein
MALAQRDWGRTDSSKVVRAWRLFADAYDNYPLTNAFQYYGPAHDGVVWPLHLKPVHRVLSPTWRLDYPPSGDRIGECFSGTHTLEEVIELCGRMTNVWQQGLDCITELEPQAANDPERLRDISTAKALGVQFRSAYNILRFYALRERLLYGPAEQKRGLLDQLRALVEEEIANSLDMAALCQANPFLGFHAESEGYRYFPAKLRWRVQLLRDMLGDEFAEVARAVEADGNTYRSLCGLTDGPDVYRCGRAPASFVSAWRDSEAWTLLPRASCTNASDAAPAPRTRWQAAHDEDALYVNVECVPTESWQLLSVSVHVEPTHAYPRRTFRVDAQGRQNARLGWLFPETPWESVAIAGSAQSIRLRIPLDTFLGEADHSRPMRLNVQVHYGQRTGPGRLVQSWIQPSGPPPKPRLGYGAEDPRQMGWLRLE